MNSTQLPIIYTADVAEGEREDFPEAMIFAWNQNNEQSVPVRGVVQVEKTATGKA